MPYTEEILKQLRHQRWIFLALNIVAAVALGILFYLILHQQHRLDYQSAQIQRERADSILTQCQDQNRRHDETIYRLRHLSPAFTPTGLSNTILLVDALQPKRNCRRLVEQFVPSAP